MSKPDVGIVVDTGEFNKWIVEYAAAGKKTLAEANNHQLKNWVIQSAMRTRKASAQRIAATARAEPLILWTMKKMMEKGGGKYAMMDPKKLYKFAAKKIANRRRGVGFVFAFLRIMTASVGKSFAGLAGHMVQATERNPNAEAVATFTYKRRGSRTAKQVEAIMASALVKGIPATIADIEKYIAKKLNRS